MAWVAFMSSTIFFTLRRLGLFRVDKAIEIIGLDIAEMGGLSEEVYEKIRKDFGANVSPKTSIAIERQINLSNASKSNLQSNLLSEG